MRRRTPLHVVMLFVNKFFSGEERRYSLLELVQYLRDDEEGLPVLDKRGFPPLYILILSVW